MRNPGYDTGVLYLSFIAYCNKPFIFIDLLDIFICSLSIQMRSVTRASAEKFPEAGASKKDQNIAKKTEK